MGREARSRSVKSRHGIMPIRARYEAGSSVAGRDANARRPRTRNEDCCAARSNARRAQAKRSSRPLSRAPQRIAPGREPLVVAVGRFRFCRLSSLFSRMCDPTPYPLSAPQPRKPSLFRRAGAAHVLAVADSVVNECWIAAGARRWMLGWVFCGGRTLRFSAHRVWLTPYRSPAACFADPCADSLSIDTLAGHRLCLAHEYAGAKLRWTGSGQLSRQLLRPDRSLSGAGPAQRQRMMRRNIRSAAHDHRDRYERVRASRNAFLLCN
jgi:hypothetical protein